MFTTLALTMLSIGQCGNGQCFNQPTTTYTLVTGWREDSTTHLWEYWYQGYKVGSVDLNNGVLIDERGHKNLLGSTPNNYGMDWKPDGGEHCTRDGDMCDVRKVVSYIEGNGIPDDANKTRITIIGDGSKFMTDWNAKLATKWNDKVIVCVREPTSWDVKDLYPQKCGNPTVYITDGDGKKRSVSDYSAGIDGIDRALGVIRQPIPDTKPDVDLTKPKQPDKVPLTVENIPTWVYVAGGGLILMATNRRKEDE